MHREYEAKTEPEVGVIYLQARGRQRMAGKPWKLVRGKEGPFPRVFSENRAPPTP